MEKGQAEEKPQSAKAQALLAKLQSLPPHQRSAVIKQLQQKKAQAKSQATSPANQSNNQSTPTPPRTPVIPPKQPSITTPPIKQPTIIYPYSAAQTWKPTKAYYKITVLGYITQRESIIHQFLFGYTTYSEEVKGCRQMEIDNEWYTLEILDASGTYQFTAMTDLYMKNGQCFVLCFSICSQSSFNELPELMEQIFRVKDRETVPMVIVGTYVDLTDTRVITSEQGEAFARKFNASYCEVNVKSRVDVELVSANSMQISHILQVNNIKPLLLTVTVC